MKNQENSYNTGKLTITNKRFLLPSWPKILLYLLIGSLVLVAWDARPIWNQYNNGILLQNSVSIGSVTPKPGGLAARAFDNLINGRVAQIVFWAFAGCAAYVVIWFITNIFTNLRNDVVADEFIHPPGYNRKGYWESVLARKSFLIAAVITLVGSIFMSLRLMPLLARFFITSLQPFKLWPSSGEFAGSIIGAAAVVYVLILVLHIAFNAWRTVYTDL